MQKDVGRMFGGRRERGVQTKLKTENQARRFWLVKGEYIRNLTNIWLYSVGRGNMAAAALSKTEVLLFLCSPLTLLVPTPPSEPSVSVSGMIFFFFFKGAAHTSKEK